MNLPDVSNYTFDDWIRSTADLQVEAYGRDPAGILATEGPAAFAEFWRWNTLAAIAEMVEMLDEVQWKPWANEPGRIISREAALEEIVDQMHFQGNLLRALGITGEELTAAYKAKQQKNLDRQTQEEGYDAILSKCRACGADYQGEGVSCRPATDPKHPAWCAKKRGHVNEQGLLHSELPPGTSW
jgi:hypothetical protein